MIRVRFFAQFREMLSQDAIDFELTEGMRVQDIVQHLISSGPIWQTLLDSPSVLCAINKKMSPLDATLTEEDEVALFPPVTGG
jgi:molybdopterin converting factor subunit 1